MVALLDPNVEESYTSLVEVQNEYNRRMPKVGPEEAARIDSDYDMNDTDTHQASAEDDTGANTGPIKRPGYVNINVFEDMMVPARYMVQDIRLGFMDGNAVRVGNRQFQYVYVYNKRKKGFKANSNGYMIWQLHILEPYPEKDRNEATLYFPKENDFRNLGFMTLEDNLWTGLPEMNISASVNVNDMVRWSSKYEKIGSDEFKDKNKQAFWSPDDLMVDFRLTGEAQRYSESTQLVVN